MTFNIQYICYVEGREGIDFRIGGDLSRILLDDSDTNNIVQAALAHMPGGGRNTIMDALAAAGRGQGPLYEGRDSHSHNHSQSVGSSRGNVRGASSSTQGNKNDTLLFFFIRSHFLSSLLFFQFTYLIFLYIFCYLSFSYLISCLISFFNVIFFSIPSYSILSFYLPFSTLLFALALHYSSLFSAFLNSSFLYTALLVLLIPF